MLRSICYINFLIFLFVFSNCSPKAGEKITSDILSTPLVSENDLSVLLKECGNARVVVIGDASHGTSEFYVWRAALTKRLITEKGFSIVAVEGDWNDCYKVNEYIKSARADSADLRSTLLNFNRFPAWLWQNQETAGFIKWLHDNQPMVSFYGLDIFSITENLSILANHHDTTVKKAARKALECFQEYSNDEPSYSLANAPTECSSSFLTLENIYRKWITQSVPGKFFTGNVFRSAIDGEKYYRLARSDRAKAWNLRDEHMVGTIKNILANHGKNSRIVLWVHNTHSGDAHYSEMSSTGQTNVGELLRKEYGDEVYLIGTSTYQGEVMAARTWGGKAEVMKLPPAQGGSLEFMLHSKSNTNRIILSKNIQNHILLKGWVPHRAIGAVYRAEHELYVPSVIPQRYDALIFIDSSHAIHSFLE